MCNTMYECMYVCMRVCKGGRDGKRKKRPNSHVINTRTVISYFQKNEKKNKPEREKANRKRVFD